MGSQAQLLTYQAGRLRPGLPGKTYRSRDDWLQDMEDQRVAGILKRRQYYEGTQYDENNMDCLAKLSAIGGNSPQSEKDLARAIALWNKELPEHLRLHEYSTHILESCDYIANRLSGGFRIEVNAEDARAVIQAAMDASPELSGTEDDQDYTVDGVTRETLVAGDVPVLLRWDPVDETVWPEFWDSEVVDMRFSQGRADQIDKVIVEEITWRQEPSEKEPSQVTVRRVWSLMDRVTNGEAVVFGAPEQSRKECVEQIYLLNHQGEQEKLIGEIPWGVPFLPWWIIRCAKKSLRATRGESLINEQVMKAADRYNAVEQVAWIIARYNSHSNIAVIGDNALLMSAQSQRMAKDVADILTLPGGTDLEVLSLPTDPQMIDHQKEVLTDSMYGCMGVTRVDQSSVEGMGAVSGYALEILNEKSGGTFNRLRKQMVKDWKRLLNLILDCHSYWSRAAEPDSVDVGLSVPLELGDDDTNPPARATAWEEIDPKVIFPDRKMTVDIGSGYIVDHVKIRDDYVAGLISREEALRRAGTKQPDIIRILGEINKEEQAKIARAQAAFETAGQEGGGTDRTTGSSGGLRSGSTTGSTARGDDGDDDRTDQ